MSAGTRWLPWVLALALGFGQAAHAQDTGQTDADDETSVAEPVAQDAEQDDENEDEDEDEDEQEEPVIRDGVFTPSEKIEADSEISFPADI